MKTFLSFCMGLCLCSVALLAQKRPAQLFMWEYEALQAARKDLRKKNAALMPAYRQLLTEADKALSEGPFTVVDKTLSPASGNKHDYMSIGPYWWPDPEKPDGLPYIRRDGETNPERKSEATDAQRFDMLKTNTTTLSLAYFFSKDERYAQKAAQLLRTWFLNPATRMNPHFEYAQAIPGIVEGRDIGIIDATGMVEMTQAVLLLSGSPHWKAQDQQQLQAWFAQLLKWLLTSEKGISEGNQHNNHGTWYDAQVAAYALFVNQPEVAKKILREVAQRRIVPHIAPDGSQPYELSRTRSWNYSLYNLRAMLYLALMGEKVGVNLWAFEDAEGRGIRNAIGFLAGYVGGQKEWTHQQIYPRNEADFLSFLLYAVQVYGSPFCTGIQQLAPEAATSREALLFNGLYPKKCNQ